VEANSLNFTHKVGCATSATAERRIPSTEVEMLSTFSLSTENSRNTGEDLEIKNGFGFDTDFLNFSQVHLLEDIMNKIA
jgi:hypothetical protein